MSALDLHLPHGPSSVDSAHSEHATEEATPLKRLIYSFVTLVMFISCVTPRLAAAQGTDPFVGQIAIFAFNFCPTGWALLNGQLLPISQNTALFSLLGTTYGGDGVSTFALPSWGPIYTANGGTLLPCISLFGIFPPRS